MGRSYSTIRLGSRGGLDVSPIQKSSILNPQSIHLPSRLTPMATSPAVTDAPPQSSIQKSKIKNPQSSIVNPSLTTVPNKRGSISIKVRKSKGRKPEISGSVQSERF
jgi:hypothetical protein